MAEHDETALPSRLPFSTSRRPVRGGTVPVRSTPLLLYSTPTQALHADAPPLPDLKLLRDAATFFFFFFASEVFCHLTWLSRLAPSRRVLDAPQISRSPCRVCSATSRSDLVDRRAPLRPSSRTPSRRHAGGSGQQHVRRWPGSLAGATAAGQLHGKPRQFQAVLQRSHRRRGPCAAAPLVCGAAVDARGARRPCGCCGVPLYSAGRPAGLLDRPDAQVPAR